MKRFYCNGKHGFCDAFVEDICAPCGYCDGSGGSFIEEYENPYWERICKLSERQRAKGVETYGQGLESNPAALVKRFEYLEEELIDALMYCEWIKDKLEAITGKDGKDE